LTLPFFHLPVALLEVWKTFEQNNALLEDVKVERMMPIVTN